MHNMRRAIAESHFSLGDTDEGEKCFEELIESYPKNIWGYIGWGDMYLWLRVDLPAGQTGFFDNMADRPVTSSEWQEYEIVGQVAADADN